MSVKGPIKISGRLGRNIPGDGTIYLPDNPRSPTVNECVYCGSSRDLTDEHTIPYAIFGVALLKKASCRACAVKTQQFEQRLLRDTFKLTREYLQFPSRKARKNGSWSGKRTLINSLTGEKVYLPIEEGVVGLLLVYPDYPPRALSVEDLDDRHKTRSVSFVAINSPASVIPAHLEDNWVTFNSEDIERCIAKIALCEAIRSVDVSIRDSKISNYILEGKSDTSEFIGASPRHKITDDMHWVSHQKLVRRGSDETAILTTVNLFNWLPTPSYQVLIRPDSDFQFPQCEGE